VLRAAGCDTGSAPGCRAGPAQDRSARLPGDGPACGNGKRRVGPAMQDSPAAARGA